MRVVCNPMGPIWLLSDGKEMGRSTDFGGMRLCCEGVFAVCEMRRDVLGRKGTSEPFVYCVFSHLGIFTWCWLLQLEL